MNRLLLILFITTLSTCLLHSDEITKPERVPDYPVLETEDGRVLKNCFVKRKTEEGLVIEHDSGMAMVSFFDLSDEIREIYDFDPILAMRTVREGQEQRRALRKQQVLEMARKQAEEEKADAAKELQAIAVDEWIPIEARVISVSEAGAYALVERVILKPTTVISSLGFENPGPPKRITRPIGGGVLFLRGLNHSFSPNTPWKGYMEPFPTGMNPDPNTGEKTVPVHLAVPPP